MGPTNIPPHPLVFVLDECGTIKWVVYNIFSWAALIQHDFTFFPPHYIKYYKISFNSYLGIINLYTMIVRENIQN